AFLSVPHSGSRANHDSARAARAAGRPGMPHQAEVGCRLPLSASQQLKERADRPGILSKNASRQAQGLADQPEVLGKNGIVAFLLVPPGGSGRADRPEILKARSRLSPSSQCLTAAQGLADRPEVLSKNASTAAQGLAQPARGTEQKVGCRLPLRYLTAAQRS
ncbi:hypothetical protein RRG08_058588, partial [Elysia crispata]